jgi:hypothetical protein
MSEPKAINCRLGDDDQDLKKMLMDTKDKTARVKELLRKGLHYEESGFEAHVRERQVTEAKRNNARRLAARVLLYNKR